MQPTTYDGSSDPVKLENWIQEMEKLFRLTECPPESQVNIGSYYLVKEANNWWNMIRAESVKDSQFNWEKFVEKLKERFYPTALRWRKQEEFLKLQQGKMTIQEYTDKFTELLQFATHICPTEEDKIQRYINKMDPRVKVPILGVQPSTFQHAYNIALSMHTTILEDEAEKAAAATAIRKAEFSRFQPAGKKQKTGGSGFRPKQGFQKKTNVQQRPNHKFCGRCGKEWHPGVNCDGSKIQCFKCGEPGHKAFQCTKTSVASGSGFQKTNTNTASIPQQGRVYCMTEKEAEANPDVMSGTIIVYDMPAHVLFDSGATISLISIKFVDKLALKSGSSIHAYISLPNGKQVECAREFKNIPIQISDHNLEADLKEFPMMEFDIILGMD